MNGITRPNQRWRPSETSPPHIVVEPVSTVPSPKVAPRPARKPTPMRSPREKAKLGRTSTPTIASDGAPDDDVASGMVPATSAEVCAAGPPPPSSGLTAAIACTSNDTCPSARATLAEPATSPTTARARNDRFMDVPPSTEYHHADAAAHRSLNA